MSSTNIITASEHQRMDEAESLLARAREYVTRKAAIEADVAGILAASDYAISNRTVGKYAEASAALELAQKLEPQLTQAMREAFQRVRNIEANSESRVTTAHAAIDRVIEGFVASRLDADIAGAVVDYKATPVYRSELAARKRTPGPVGHFVVPQADLAKLIEAIEYTLKNLSAIDAELQRCAAVEASFAKKLKKAA